MKVSTTQLDVILKLSAPGSPGILERHRGGWWTTPDAIWTTSRDARGEYQVPDWSVTVQTVRAMERLGLLRRTGRYSEEWRDDRELTEAWLALGLNLEPNQYEDEDAEPHPDPDWLGHEPNRKSARQLEGERQQASIARSVTKRKLEKLKAQVAALEAEKRRVTARLSQFARSARARTVIEPTTRLRGDNCQIVSADRQRQLRGEVDAFYDARRVAETAGLDAEDLRVRGEIDRTRDTGAAYAKGGKRAASALRRVKAAEAIAESDSDVEANIDPSLLHVWRAMKRQFVAGPKMSRTEAFLHWVEENPEEVTVILTQRVKDLEADLQEGQYGEEARAVAARSAPEEEYTETELPGGPDDVPFN